MKETIFPIPAFKDNYIWMILSLSEAWVVDPGDAGPVIAALTQKKLKLKGILITHHHHDHTGGVSSLLRHAGDIPVYGSHRSNFDLITHIVREDDTVHLFSLPLTVIEIPGHTLDHIAYYGENILFCGDTLFSGGCGRVFEGTYENMYDSLNKIYGLNDQTKIFCGHEYTLANLYFAQQVEPLNQDIANKIKQVEEILKKKNCSLPSVLECEKKFNPFLRCHLPEVVHAVQEKAKMNLKKPVDVFQFLREWKNNF